MPSKFTLSFSVFATFYATFFATFFATLFATFFATFVPHTADSERQSTWRIDGRDVHSEDVA